MSDSYEQRGSSEANSAGSASVETGGAGLRKGLGGLGYAEASRRLSPSAGLLSPPSPRAIAWTGGRAAEVEGGGVCEQEDVKVPDCAEDPYVTGGTAVQRDALTKALEHGRKAGTAAVNHLFSDDIGRSSAFVDWFGGEGGTTGITDDTIRTARTVASAALRGLNGSVPLEIDWFAPLMAPDAVAYVAGARVEWLDPIYRSLSNIHLPPLFFEKGTETQGVTLFHECTHKYAGTHDHEYGGASRNLTQAQQLENADSYTMFASDVYAGHVAVMDEKQAECEQALLDTRIDEALAMVLDGSYEVWQPLTLADGTHFGDGQMVAASLAKAFVAKYPTHTQELITATEAYRVGTDPNDEHPMWDDFTCADGLLLPERLLSALADELNLHD